MADKSDFANQVAMVRSSGEASDFAERVAMVRSSAEASSDTSSGQVGAFVICHALSPVMRFAGRLGVRSCS